MSMVLELTDWLSLTKIFFHCFFLCSFFFLFHLLTLDYLIIELSLCFWQGFPSVPTSSQNLHANLDGIKSVFQNFFLIFLFILSKLYRLVDSVKSMTWVLIFSFFQNTCFFLYFFMEKKIESTRKVTQVTHLVGMCFSWVLGPEDI